MTCFQTTCNPKKVRYIHNRRQFGPPLRSGKDVADKITMSEQRTEPRLLCADLVRVKWRDKRGQLKAETMNLEDISLSGACLQSGSQVLKGTALSVHYGNGMLQGLVRYCVYRETGYFLGIEFTGECKWPTNQFRPKHLLDPRTLVERAVRPDA